MSAKPLNTTQAAERLGVARSTILLWLRTGRIKDATQLGREWAIPESALENSKIPEGGFRRGRPKKSAAS